MVIVTRLKLKITVIPSVEITGGFFYEYDSLMLLLLGV